MKPKLISVADFCTLLGIKKTKAYSILDQVESIHIGRRRLIVRSSAMKLIKRSLKKGAD